MEDFAISSSSSNSGNLKEWVYESGSQFPLSEKAPQKGSVLKKTLEENLMIEVQEKRRKGSVHIFTVLCHSCQKKYKSQTAQKLKEHVSSVFHQKSLLPETVKKNKEKARRQLILSNKKFADFIVLHEDQTLWCKYCNVELQFLSNKLSDHRHSLKHKTAAGQKPIDLTEAERLAKIQKLVSQFPDVVGMVTDMDVHVNEEYFEHYKEKEEITLQLNDIFCKICRRKFVRTDPNGYRDAIRRHLKTEQHKKALESTQQQADDEDGSKVKPAKSPPKKISTYRHDPEDLKEAVRHSCEANLSSSQCSKAGRKIIQSVIGRTMSAWAMSKGFALVDSDITESMNILKTKQLGITVDEASIQGNLLNVSIRALDDLNIPPFKRIFLLDGAANGQSVAKAIVDVLRTIWPSDQELHEHQHQFRTLMTDGAAYMGSAAKVLRSFGFTSLIHSQCIVHGLSLVCETALKNHELLLKFAHSVQSTMSCSVAHKAAYHESSNQLLGESFVKLLYDQNGLSLTDGKKKKKKTSVEAMVSEIDNKLWPTMTDDKKCSQLWSKVRSHASLISTEGGEIAEMLPEDRTPPPKGCDTRFATELVLLSYCHHFFIQAINYCSKLEQKTSRKEDKSVISKLHKQIAEQSDDIKEGLEYVFSVFSEIPVHLCALEGQTLRVSEVEEKLAIIRQYLEKGIHHPLEAKYGSVRAALTKLSAVEKRVENLFQAARLDPILDYAPCHSIEVEADFSFIRHRIGHRKHFSKPNLSSYLQVAISQQAAKRCSETSNDELPKPSKQRRFYTQADEEKRLAIRQKKFDQKRTDPLLDHTYARPPDEEPLFVVPFKVALTPQISPMAPTTLSLTMPPQMAMILPPPTQATTTTTFH